MPIRPVSGLSDAALLARFKAGEARAFDELYQRHRGSLYRYYLRQAPRSVADDLFQETWLRVLKGAVTYEPNAPFPAFLFRIAHNVLVDHYRRMGRTPEVVTDGALDLADPDPQPSESYAKAQLHARFIAALEALPAEQREAFLLHQEAGLTLEQVAAVVGSNFETVKSRLRYAVARLRKLLDDAASTQRKQA
jgi:RNA polymerase sigma-70 factor (ECF subfamily)